jgi:hypothetical protein
MRPLVTMDQLWTLATTWYPDTPKPWRRRFDALTRELAASAARRDAFDFASLGLGGDFWDPQSDSFG